MDGDIQVQPLPRGQRQNFFFLLLGLFMVTLPLLFLYAAGYRFELGGEGAFVSTGGIYVAAERSGAEIYIDNELVRETRTFRTAFYAQGLEPGTHRVHVQKPGHNTWVKELPVYAHIVTEAEAFNLPLVPTARTLSPWKNGEGETVVFTTLTLAASSTNTVVVATSTATRSLIPDTEFATLAQAFASSTEESVNRSLGSQIQTIFTQTGDEESVETIATTTEVFNGVKLGQQGDNVYATFIGSREQMPYYYCAKEFEFSMEGTPLADRLKEIDMDSKMLMGPVEFIPDDIACNPTILIDRQNETVHAFEFYPGSSDLVLMALDSGIFVVEIDNRAWQNAQPLVLGSNLMMLVQNGNVYVYDGTLIYQILVEA